jgi:hypothetical protein
MIVGHNHHLLEKRISAALLSGKAKSGEATFLHNISTKILSRGKSASLTDAQARWLFALLERLKPTRPPRPSSPRPAKLNGHPPSEGFAWPEPRETPSLLQSIRHDPSESTRNRTSPPHVVTSFPAQESASHLIKSKALRETASTRPTNVENLDDWFVSCFARMEARRRSRDSWLAGKTHRRLYNQQMGPKDISSD